MAARTQATKTQRRTTGGRGAHALSPADVQSLPRFALSPTAQGSLLADQILDEFRKDLAGLNLKAKRHTRASHKQRN